MAKTKPLIAINNTFQDNRELRKSTIKFIKKEGNGDIVALNNAKRIEEISNEGAKKNTNDISGLELAMKELGFDPNKDASSHVQREFVAPIGVEREDW